MKAFGELPLLSLSISDHKLQEILQLVQSIPTPDSAPPPPEEDFLKVKQKDLILYWKWI